MAGIPACVHRRQIKAGRIVIYKKELSAVSYQFFVGCALRTEKTTSLSLYLIDMKKQKT